MPGGGKAINFCFIKTFLSQQLLLLVTRPNHIMNTVKSYNNTQLQEITETNNLLDPTELPNLRYLVIKIDSEETTFNQKNPFTIQKWIANVGQNI